MLPKLEITAAPQAGDLEIIRDGIDSAVSLPPTRALGDCRHIRTSPNLRSAKRSESIFGETLMCLFSVEFYKEVASVVNSFRLAEDTSNKSASCSRLRTSLLPLLL